MRAPRVPRPPRNEPRAAPARTRPPAVRRAATGAMPRHDIGGVPLAGPVQRRAAPVGSPDAVTRAPNRTGLPAGLKAGIEAASGLSMDAVRVHYGSPEPKRIDAHAFADGTDIHLAPGQERHLPHEAWHVVQQAEGRVKPTRDLGGTAVNDDPGLEREADRMGEISASHGRDAAASAAPPAAPVAAPAAGVVQGVFTIGAGDMKGTYSTKGGRATKALIEEIRATMGDELRAGWVGAVSEWADKYEGPYRWKDTDEFLEFLVEEYAKPAKDGKTRPNFSSIAYKLAKITYAIQTGTDQSSLSPSDEDLAMPHRFPYAGIELGVSLFITGKESATDLERWTDRLYDATEERRDLNLPEIKNKGERAWYLQRVNEQLAELKNARGALIAARNNGDSLSLNTPVVQRLLKAANNMHGNIPDYGPHSKVNIPVSNRLHLHVDKPSTWDPNDDDRVAPLSPGSSRAIAMSPHRVPKGIAFDRSGKYLVTTDGSRIEPDYIDQYGSMSKKHKRGDTTIDQKTLSDF